VSFKDVLAELPSLTIEQRQLLMRRALEIDDPALSPADLALIEQRQAEYRQNPAAALTLQEMESRLRAKARP